MITKGSGSRRKKQANIIKNTVLTSVGDNVQSEKIKGRIFTGFYIFATFFGIVSLASLLVYVFYDAAGWLDLQFVTSAPSRFAEKAGVYPMLVGSIFVVSLVAVFSLPLGALNGRVGYSRRYSATMEEMMLYIALPIHSNGEVIGVLRLSRFLKNLKELIKDLKLRIIVFSLAIVAFSLFVAALFSNMLSKPIKELSEAAKRVAQGD